MALDSTVRELSRTIILMQIIPYLKDPVSVLEELNDKSPLFKNEKICIGVVTRNRKEEVCGKAIKSRTNYCATCVKKLEKNGKCSLKLSKIGKDEDGYYWNQENDHIYRLDGKKLLLIGVRDGISISYEVSKKVIREAAALGIFHYP